MANNYAAIREASSIFENKNLIEVIEAHWLSLPSQGNVYSLTKLFSSHKPNKVLVASLKRKIYSCEYHYSHPWYLRPLVKEQLFTYIPSGAEIISIDAYNKQDSGNDLVIGVTIVKQNNESSVDRYLNIYTEGVGDGETEDNSSVEMIAQNCLTVELSYTPYHLYHTYLPPNESGNEIVWLISGDDKKIHTIREDKWSHGYAEVPTENFFPELADLRAVALKIVIHYYENGKRRLTMVGCKCGLVKVWLIDVEKLEIKKCWSLRYDNPISTVDIFLTESAVERPAFLGRSTPEVCLVPEPFLNILVVDALNGAVVFHDVLRRGMTADVALIGSESANCVLCSCIADFNMDGQNEILLGTYDQKVIVFSRRGDVWEMTKKIEFDAAVHSISYVDLSGDGMKELVVLTQRGVHIMQHDPREVSERWKERFRDALARKLL